MALSSRELNIQFRIASSHDCDKIFRWRNHPRVRRFSLNTEEIDYAEHKQWLAQVLKDKNRILLIATQDEEDVGVLRFEIESEKHLATVSIYVRPDMQHQGVGSKVIMAGEEWVRKEKPYVRELIAKVRSNNLASIRLFRKAGFASNAVLFSKKL